MVAMAAMTFRALKTRNRLVLAWPTGDVKIRRNSLSNTLENIWTITMVTRMQPRIITTTHMASHMTRPMLTRHRVLKQLKAPVMLRVIQQGIGMYVKVVTMTTWTTSITTNYMLITVRGSSIRNFVNHDRMTTTKQKVFVTTIVCECHSSRSVPPIANP